MIDFFVVMESSELETCIAIKKDVTEMVIEEVIDAANVNIAEINGHLNHPRMHEYEDMYYNILESNTDNELDVIG